MPAKRRLLGEYLIENGIITEDQLKQAIDEGKKTNRKIGDTLIRLGFAKEIDVVKALSEQLGIPFIDVSSYQFDLASIALVPSETARRLMVIPVYRIANAITVAMTDPLNVAIVDELEKITGYTITPVFSTSSGILDAINKYYGKEMKKEEVAVEIVKTQDRTPIVQKGKDQEIPKLIEEATQAPVIQLVNKIILDAIKLKASDIHLEPQDKGFSCRYRVDGILKDFVPLDETLQSAIISRIKIMSDINIAEKRLPQDGRVQMNIEKKEIDLRVATFPTIHGEHVAIRVLDKSTGILNLDQLGLEGALLKSLKSLVVKPHGIILVTGPTGSGKSTTLYSILNTINDKKKNIITLEDPVEYGINNIHQSQVNVKAGLTFAIGLRSIVRLDPDIIMIGEIRDRETAEIAIHAALTGHLVFSTLHTNDAPSACARLIDVGVEPYLVASSLTGILAQRLVRKLCSKCKKSYSPSKEDISLLNVEKNIQNEKLTFYKEAGCKSCDMTGFSGRTGIYELLIPSDSFREMIIKKASARELQQEAKASGMTTLMEDGLNKIKSGLTSLSEVLRITEEV